MVATSYPGGHLQGGFGLAIGYAAATGAYDVASAPANHRSFYLKTVIASKANVKQAIATAADPAPSLNFKDIWAPVGDAIPENL
jgi:hypothetical protein